MSGCMHDVVLYGTAPGALRPENAVCVECREIVTVEFWADDRAVAFAAVRAPAGWWRKKAARASASAANGDGRG